MRRRVVALIAVLGTGVTRPLTAQRSHTVTLDATVGGGYGRGGGERENRNILSTDAVLAWRARRVAGGSPLVGMNGGWQGNIGDDAVCRLGADGQCVPDYPSFTFVGALVGWEVTRLSRERGPSGRVAAGPGYYRAVGGEAVGLQARVDLATAAPFGVALVASVRGTVVPNFRGEALAIGTIGFGVRVQ